MRPISCGVSTLDVYILVNNLGRREPKVFGNLVFSIIWSVLDVSHLKLKGWRDPPIVQRGLRVLCEPLSVLCVQKLLAFTGGVRHGKPTRQ